MFHYEYLVVCTGHPQVILALPIPVPVSRFFSTRTRTRGMCGH
jgi:hypothetical protein